MNVFVLCQFQTQQIYCARDRDGNITEGAKVCIWLLLWQILQTLLGPSSAGTVPIVAVSHFDTVHPLWQDEIHTVHYAWAMQQVIPGEIQEFDIHRRWKLREMQQLGIQALI